jgi:hypothetical protein
MMDDAVEGSTYVVQVTFKDEAGVTMVPADASWSLYDNYQQIVNSRADVTITPLASVVSIVLSGSDLSYEPNARSMRTLCVKAHYDGTYGSNLPLKQEFSFNIAPLVGVTDS